MGLKNCVVKDLYQADELSFVFEAVRSYSRVFVCLLSLDLGIELDLS